jgi:hypothetical protein
MRIGNNLLGGSYYMSKNIKIIADYHGVLRHTASSLRSTTFILN